MTPGGTLQLGTAQQFAPNVVGDLLVYDHKADAWLVVGGLPEKVMSPSAAIVGGKLVVVGGGPNNPRPLTAATWVAEFPGKKTEKP